MCPWFKANGDTTGKSFINGASGSRLFFFKTKDGQGTDVYIKLYQRMKGSGS
jgi:hypothetical protein